MIALNHVLTGTAIGLAVRQPLLVALLAFISHFILDIIPHYDYGKPPTRRFWISWIIDALLTVIATLIIVIAAPEFAFVILLGGLFAEAPDAFWVYYFARSQPKHWFFTFHKRIQWSETTLGIIPEILYLIGIIVVNIVLLQQL